MAIDFTLTPPQRELQLESRRFAVEVLAGARAAELLPTAEDRFLATRPVYEAMVVAGFLRKCIPQPAGGENAGLIDMAIRAEEFYSVNASVTLTMLGTVLGLLPILLGGTPEQCGRLLAPFLRKSGTPLAGFCSSDPAAAPTPHLRRLAKACVLLLNFRATAGSSMAGRNGSPRQPGGIVKVRMSYAWCAGPRRTLQPRKRFPSSRSNAPHPASSSSAQSSPGSPRASDAAIRFRERLCAAAQSSRGGRRRPRPDGRRFTGTAALVGILGGP